MLNQGAVPITMEIGTDGFINIIYLWTHSRSAREELKGLEPQVLDTSLPLLKTKWQLPEKLSIQN